MPPTKAQGLDGRPRGPVVRSLTGILALAALGAGLAACSSSASPKTTTGPTTASVGSGCGTSATAGTSTLSLTVGGVSRIVRVHVPTGYTGSLHVALVLNLHGSGSNAVEQEGFTGMDQTSDADGFVVAYPQADIASGSGFVWNIPGVPLIGGAMPPANAANDEVYLQAVVTKLEHQLCIDPKRVYSTGFSGGARMSSQLGCDASNVFAAVAPVSGLRLPSPCSSVRPVPVLSFHGTADPVDPYNGNGQKYWTYSVPVAAQRWAAHDGCGATPTVTHPAATVTSTAYTGCQGGTDVTLYTIAGEGHEWPGGPTLPHSITRGLGAQTKAIDANNLIWSFFSSHTLP